MKITGIDLGKKFESRWIFRNLNIDLESGESLALTGANGSGKSTLLQILANSLTPSAGKIEYSLNDQIIENEEFATKASFSAPYIELVEELSLREHLAFHAQFKSPTISINEIMARMGYPEAADRPIRQFSSGMKQRLRLAMCFYFDAQVRFFDEPTSNLDESGVKWYMEEMKEHLGKCTILIASNQRFEYDFCQKNLILNI